jgi:hypothetical protein
MCKQECPFVHCIITFDIKRRVAFRETQLLREQQSLLKIKFILKHFGEDKIRGSIDDSFYRM